MEKNGWSQETFADKARIHHTDVSDIDGTAWKPTTSVVEKLAEPLGVSGGTPLE